MSRARSGCADRRSSRTTAWLSSRRRSAGQALLDGAARDLVPESDPLRPGDDDPSGLGLGQRLKPRPEQLGTGRRRHDRELVERGAAVVAQADHAREHRVGDARGHASGRRGEHFGDEERVAARDPHAARRGPRRCPR